MDGRRGRWQISVMPVPVNKLSDRFANYDLSIECKRCGHVCVTPPHVIARLLGWEATLDTVASRLRCSKFGTRGQCELTAQVQHKPGGDWSLALVYKCGRFATAQPLLHSMTSSAMTDVENIPAAHSSL
jgi:hypothetical protein